MSEDHLPYWPLPCIPPGTFWGSWLLSQDIFSYYRVGQNVCWGFIRCYVKTQRTFWPTQYTERAQTETSCLVSPQWYPNIREVWKSLTATTDDDDQWWWYTFLKAWTPVLMDTLSLHFALFLCSCSFLMMLYVYSMSLSGYRRWMTMEAKDNRQKQGEFSLACSRQLNTFSSLKHHRNNDFLSALSFIFIHLLSVCVFFF